MEDAIKNKMANPDANDGGKAIIVGAGIAGITCALELQKAGIPYTIVSPDIGGRIDYEEEWKMNFGAVFFMKGYEHAKQILKPGKPVLPSYLDLECHYELGRGFGVLSTDVLSSAPELVHFMIYLKKTFAPHYKDFKRACEVQEVSDAIAADPYIASLFAMKATELIENERFPKAAKTVVSQFVHACTGSYIDTLNALDYLNCAMGLIDTAMRFTFDPAEMLVRLENAGDSVVLDRAKSIEKNTGGWRVCTERGESFEAPNLVLAAPANVTKELLVPVIGDYEIRNASSLYAYKVAGKIKGDYAHHKLHLFDQNLPLINIGARPDGAYEVFTCKPLDMALFFDEYEVLHQKAWEHALFTNPSVIIDQDLGDGLYRIGDHNALGLEPAAISGVFAANKIKEKHQVGGR